MGQKFRIILIVLEHTTYTPQGYVRKYTYAEVSILLVYTVGSFVDLTKILAWLEDQSWRLGRKTITCPSCDSMRVY